MFARQFDQHTLQLLQVCAVSNADGQPDANARVTMTPVHHPVGDEIRIGHDDGDVIVCHDRRAAETNLLHLPSHVADFDSVTNRDWPLGENDQSADEIVNDVLQAETDAYPDRACHHRQRSQIQSYDLQGDVKAQSDENITSDFRDGELQRWGESRPPQNTPEEISS